MRREKSPNIDFGRIGKTFLIVSHINGKYPMGFLVNGHDGVECHAIYGFVGVGFSNPRDSCDPRKGSVGKIPTETSSCLCDDQLPLVPDGQPSYGVFLQQLCGRESPPATKLIDPYFGEFVIGCWQRSASGCAFNRSDPNFFSKLRKCFL